MYPFSFTKNPDPLPFHPPSDDVGAEDGRYSLTDSRFETSSVIDYPHADMVTSLEPWFITVSPKYPPS